MTDMLVARTLMATASGLVRDVRFARITRLDILRAVIEEYRDRLPRTPRGTWLAALVLGLSLLALSGPP